MRFRRDSTEEACGCPILSQRYTIVCMRTKGHEGEHLGRVDQAAKADGVCWECREPVDKPHKGDCGQVEWVCGMPVKGGWCLRMPNHLGKCEKEGKPQ